MRDRISRFPDRGGWAGRLLTAGVLLGVGLLAWGAVGEIRLEGNPFQGRELLSEKLCTECHSVWSHGGILGPDLATAVAGKSWLDLVGDFWNHTPRMMDEMTRRGHAWPTLDEREIADLLSYLYYLRLFDDPGIRGEGRSSTPSTDVPIAIPSAERGKKAAYPWITFPPSLRR